VNADSGIMNADSGMLNTDSDDRERRLRPS
jgi:hypothetical protein